MTVNRTTADLAPYPMEELGKIRQRLQAKGVPVFDFGTGDPRIPTWPPIRDALRDAIPETSSYPSVRGTDNLQRAISGYLSRRFQIELDEHLAVAPTAGSKEAVFHTALSLVGRAGGKRHMIYPDPGYPVYRSSTLFAGGIPYPVKLDPARQYRLEPWDLPKHVQSDAAALWLNYPHNPTGATVDEAYWQKVAAWGQETDTLILSDDCYVDIYEHNMPDEERPTIPVQFASKGVLSFLSLSKRSGLTGYRSGFIVGDAELVKHLQMARANMGVASPTFVQAAATAAWDDDDHVSARREIFTDRVQQAGEALKELGMIEEIPRATFYLWAQVPEPFKGNDLKFCQGLAERGVIASPSRWLSEGIKGYVRFALVPDSKEIASALEILREFVKGA